ncbi:MAG: iron-containing alcohol dehydrogenase family protein [Lachnospiraceae bacterium]|nr:iron-containing alcohol dehydrogenase family protein [Lachnospiraceae bacterium]
MNQHSRFNLPLCLVVEEDVFGNVDEAVQRYLPEIRGQKALIITEKFLHDLYGDIVEEIGNDFGGAEVLEVVNADFDEAVGMAKKICIDNIKVVIGFGGGRVLDVAKYAAFIGKAVYICLPTNLSNDSLASPFSVLGTVGSNRKTLACKIPTAILVDTTMIQKAPVTQTIGGIGDTIAKYTAVYDWSLAAEAEGKPVDDFAYSIAWMCYDSVAHCDEKSLTSKNFLRILARALVMGGLAMEIAGSSRPCSGSEHLFCHALEEYYPQIKISHGYAVALGSVGAANFQGRDDRKMIEVCKTYGLDLNPATYGIDKDLFAEIWSRAASTRPDRVTILNKTDLNRKWLDEIYDRMAE